MSRYSIELGLGLIGIGKPWGHNPRPVPSDMEARSLLEYAFELGIRYFDTAPSYGDGLSEARLSEFLRSLTPEQRAQVTAATKMGEHWNARTGEPYADHSYDALQRSLARSLERMGRIDVLQLHKTTPDVLRSPDVARAWDDARRAGIARLGPSVSDLESARMAVADARYSAMQLPFNRENQMFAPVFEEAAARDMWIAVNRPFAMGAMVEKGADKRAAFQFILEREFRGVILTGTTARHHLEENWRAFQEAAQ